MNEQHFAYKIRLHLNRGLHELRPQTADRLLAARQRALANQRQAVRQSVLASVGAFVQYPFENPRIRQAIGALALLLSVVGSTYWIADQRVAELGEIDSALLADELPISAFTDIGFDAWLKHDASQ
jgi:hypothetical protein